MKTFSPDQLHALVLLSFNLYGTASNLFCLLFGIASMHLVYLLVRSGYLPRALGTLWVLGGLGLETRNVVWILASAYASFHPSPA